MLTHCQSVIDALYLVASLWLNDTCIRYVHAMLYQVACVCSNVQLAWVCMLQAKSEEVSHVQATWEHHENSMIDAQIQLGDLKIVLEASQKAEEEAKAAREAAEATLAGQNSELDRLRSRLAGAEAEMDELRTQASRMCFVCLACLALQHSVVG